MNCLFDSVKQQTGRTAMCRTSLRRPEPSKRTHSSSVITSAAFPGKPDFSLHQLLRRSIAHSSSLSAEGYVHLCPCFPRHSDQSSAPANASWVDFFLRVRERDLRTNDHEGAGSRMFSTVLYKNCGDLEHHRALGHDAVYSGRRDIFQFSIATQSVRAPAQPFRTRHTVRRAGNEGGQSAV